MKIQISGIEDLEMLIAQTVRKATENEIKAISESIIKNSNKEYLTRKEAAQYFKCSLPSIDKATKEGVLISYRLLGTILYLKSELDNALLKRVFDEPRRGERNGK
jgi:hypothetical protein